MATLYYYTTKNHNLTIRFGQDNLEASFVGGKFKTDDPKLQKLLKDSSMAKSGRIVISDSDQGSPQRVQVEKGVSTTKSVVEN